MIICYSDDNSRIVGASACQVSSCYDKSKGSEKASPKIEKMHVPVAVRIKFGG